jgi:outer membrane protein insertion porin family
VRPLAVLAVLAAGALPAVARQAPPAGAYVGKNVVSIAIVIAGRPSSDAMLMSAVQMKRNQPLDMSEVRETMTHLYTVGRFDDVEVEAETVAGGVAITILLEPIHVVTKVEFRGELGLSEGALRDRMIERFGSTPAIAQAADVASALQQLYADSGYLQASVKPAAPIIAQDPDRATLVFDVTAGPRVLIARAAVTGNPLEPAARVVQRLHFAAGEPYQPGDLRERIGAYLAWMRRQGHYQADIRDLAPRFNADRTQVELTVDVQPGPLVVVRFTGDPLPSDKRAELVPIEREGSVDQDILEDSARRITDYLQQQGYWKADVAPPEPKEENGQLTIVFNVKRGPLFRVAPGGVQVNGLTVLTPEIVRPFLRTLPEGDPFVASRMSAIEGAIRQEYRKRGYALAELESQPNQTGPTLVQPVIAVKEGPRVVIGSIAIQGNDKLAAQALIDATGLRTGAPYYGPDVAAARDKIETQYLNLGFQSAEVTVPQPKPVADPAGARADLVFQVREGPQTKIEHIFVTGNVNTKKAVIDRELRIREGEPLGQQELTQTRANLSALGLFRRIQISSVNHGDPGRSDVIVAVQESQQTTIDYGGGAEVERTLRESSVTGAPVQRWEFAPRGFFEIGRRNIGGKNRSMNLYTRFGLRPNGDPQDSNLFGFSEYRVVGTYREPKALGNYGDLTGTAAVEQGVRTGFNFIRKGLNAELTHRLSARVIATAQYAFTTTHIFDEVLSEQEQLTVDRVFSQVRLSTFAGALSRDTRDDLLAPQHGTLVSADATVALRALGSEVGFAKLFLQGFFYRDLGRRNLVFAGGARVGVARALQRVVDGTIVEDLPASERFFSGGDTTVRGFARDSLGRPETLTANGFPRGGDAEMIFNAELRMPVKGDLGAVVFTDSGNVFAKAADFSLPKLRASLGLGARYRSPFGPIRIDFGFPVHRYVIGNELEKRFQIHFSMGHAF